MWGVVAEIKQYETAKVLNGSLTKINEDLECKTEILKDKTDEILKESKKKDFRNMIEQFEQKSDHNKPRSNTKISKLRLPKFLEKQN